MGLRTLYGVFLTYREATGEYPDSGARLRPVDGILKNTLGEPYSDHVPLRDGWGAAYLYNALDWQLIIVSAGPNGVVDDPEAILALQTNRGGSFYSAKTIDGDDVIMIGGSIAKRTPGHRQRQLRTIADMRLLGTALAEYKLDHGAMPGPTDGFVRAHEVADHLVPEYIKRAPLRDAWDSDLKLWCGKLDCVVVSFGGDRKPDMNYRGMAHPVSEIEPVGRFTSPGTDIIMINDTFINIPYGVSH